MTTQTDFKAVIEDEEGEEEAKSATETQTIEQNYRETVELVKKYIRVDVPNIGSKDLPAPIDTPKADLSLN